MWNVISMPSERLRILHVITGLGRGGAETMLLKLIQGTDSTRIQHTVISLTDEGVLANELRRCGAHVEALRLGRNPARLIQLLRLAKRERPAIIHAWMYHANIAVSAVVWGLRPRPKLIWGIRHTPHHRSTTKPFTWMLIQWGRMFARSADLIAYNAEVSRQRHIALGYPSSKSIVIPNGFDTTIFRPVEDAGARLRGILNVDRETALIGVVARFHPIKGYDVLLDAAQHVSESNSEKAFVLIGRDVDETNGELMRWIARRNLGQQVHLLGERKDIASLLPGLDVLVSPSRSEAFSNAIGEAMACGVPCIVSNVGDSARLVGDTGLVFTSGDARALADVLTEFLEAGDARKRELGVRARLRIQELYSLEEVCDRYSRMYATLLAP